MVFHWSLNDSKSPQVSIIVADVNSSVARMASTRPLIFKPSSPCTNLLVTVPSAPITIGITVTYIFQIFFVL